MNYAATIAFKLLNLHGRFKTVLPAMLIWMLIFSGTRPETPAAKGNLTGTKWTLSYINQQGKEKKILLIFNRGGVLQNKYPNHHSWDEDKWSQEGKQVTLSFSDGYAIYKGVVKGRTMKGTATNQPGLTWSWTAVKNHRP